MIIENRSTEIGDIIYIKADTPLMGILTLVSFVDNTENETGTRLFNKKFRYSIDGINYSDWAELTNPNLAAISIAPNNIFYAEYLYERIGADASSELVFNSVELSGTFESIPQTYYENSIFYQFFNQTDPGVLNWAVNVLEKLYKRGILPKFIERNQNENNEDEDFIAYWFTITTFFAYIVHFCRQFETFSSNPILLREYLSQWDLLFEKSSMSLLDLVTLKENFLRVISQRGTENIYSEREANALGVQGELLNLLKKNALDEFIVCITESEHIGWTLRQSSPSYKGNFKERGLIKGYEKRLGTLILSKYPLLENNGDISLVEEGEENAIKITSPGGEIVGINGAINRDYENAIIIDPLIDYEITFLIKSNSDFINSEFTFDIVGLDKEGATIDFKDITNSSTSNVFLDEVSLNQQDIYYQIKGIIFSYNTLDFNSYSNFNNSSPNLRFDKRIVKILPQVYLKDMGEDTEINIKDFKVRPLRTNYSKGFFSTKAIQLWIKNNNQSLTNQELTSILEERLFPYSRKLFITWLNDTYDKAVTYDIDDEVIHLGIKYKALEENTGVIPSTTENTTTWKTKNNQYE